MQAIQAGLLCPSCGWKLAYYNNNSPDTSRWHVVCENDSEHCGNSGVKYRLPTVELVPVEKPEYRRVRLRAKDAPTLPQGLKMECFDLDYGWEKSAMFIHTISGAALKPQPNRNLMPFVTQNSDGSLSYEDGYTVLMDGSVLDPEVVSETALHWGEQHGRGFIHVTCPDIQENPDGKHDWTLDPSMVTCERCRREYKLDQPAPPPATEHDAMADFFGKRTKL